LRCLDAWAGAAGKTKTFDYGAVANVIVAGLQQLKDNSSRKNFFKYRSSGSDFVMLAPPATRIQWSTASMAWLVAQAV
jgi:hypothetical protein